MQIVLAQRPRGDQDLAQQGAGLLLQLDGLGKLQLADQAVADQEVAQVLLGLGRRGGQDAPVLEIDPLLDLAAVDLERAALLALRQPLQQLVELHGAEVANDAHGLPAPIIDRPAGG